MEDVPATAGGPYSLDYMSTLGYMQLFPSMVLLQCWLE